MPKVTACHADICSSCTATCASLDATSTGTVCMRRGHGMQYLHGVPTLGSEASPGRCPIGAVTPACLGVTRPRQGSCRYQLLRQAYREHRTGLDPAVHDVIARSLKEGSLQVVGLLYSSHTTPIRSKRALRGLIEVVWKLPTLPTWIWLL